MMRNGNHLVTHSSPRSISTKIVSSSNESEFNFNAYMLEKRHAINQALDAAVPLKEPLKLVGGTESTVMPVACAIEMILAVWVVCDCLPCMDNHDLCRGKPSTHKSFGEAMTILATYSLSALAFEYITKATKLGVTSANIVRVLSETARLLMEEVADGQAADIFEAQVKSGIGIEQLEYIYLRKIAQAFEGSVVAGAIVGGASQEEINRLRKYGRYTGLLFQIKDDIIDYEKDLFVDKITYSKLIGKEKSMEVIEKLIRKAEDELEGFDPEKAAPLKALLCDIDNW
ncbi:hypothetical protein M9H77_05472 [Catharanthus roseus]|uniref:Uncharacterized protein n=1 Tax=Catharanthus roseus TaxID=4058 RepID=A0ACC0CH10_CATRO|nr:hypothetical protein M9H77_05472 [Catharanthus roseus]